MPDAASDLCSASLMRFAALAFSLSSAAIAGCQSPSAQVPPPSYDPPYQVGGEGSEVPPAEPNPNVEKRYEYRGGRDPVTGRAATQM